MHALQNCFYAKACYSSLADLPKFLKKSLRTFVDIFLTAMRELYSMTYNSCILWFGLKRNCNFHGINPAKLSANRAVLFLHGDNPSNQSSAFQLAKKLQRAGIQNVFTVNMRYDDNNPLVHEKQLADRLTGLWKLRPDKGRDLVIDFIGHSKGGIEAVHYAACREQVRGVHIGKIITIASRLKVVPSERRSCPQPLRSRVNAVYEGLQRSTVILFNIAPARDWDWLVPLEASCVVDKSKVHLVKNTSHLSVLFADETHQKVIEILQSYTPRGV